MISKLNCPPSKVRYGVDFSADQRTVCTRSAITTVLKPVLQVPGRASGQQLLHRKAWSRVRRLEFQTASTWLRKSVTDRCEPTIRIAIYVWTQAFRTDNIMCLLNIERARFNVRQHDNGYTGAAAKDGRRHTMRLSLARRLSTIISTADTKHPNACCSKQSTYFAHRPIRPYWKQTKFLTKYQRLSAPQSQTSTSRRLYILGTPAEAFHAVKTINLQYTM